MCLVACLNKVTVLMFSHPRRPRCRQLAVRSLGAVDVMLPLSEATEG